MQGLDQRPSKLSEDIMLAAVDFNIIDKKAINSIINLAEQATKNPWDTCSFRNRC